MMPRELIVSGNVSGAVVSKRSEDVGDGPADSEKSAADPADSGDRSAADPPTRATGRRLTRRLGRQVGG